jgi:hypothetical protein
MPSVGSQLVLHHGGHERISVDLAVRMAERYTDRFSAVLEDVDIPDIAEAAELLGPVTPHLDQVLDVLF